MRIALVAPQISVLREPHLGGAQTHLADLALGLTGRGHRIDVFAAAGSRIPGVAVIDTGVDAASLRETLFRPDGRTTATSRGLSMRVFASVYRLVASGDYDVVHNHAFDAPAVQSASSLAVPVLHTLHLPPAPEMASAIAQAQASTRPPRVAAVSGRHAQAWAEFVRVDAVLRPGVPTSRIRAVIEPGSGLLFAGRLSPEKGAVEAIEISRRAGMPIRLYGDPYDDAYAGRVAALSLWPDIVLHAAVPRSRLWTLLGASRGLLCPVSWDEPYGMVAAEAQAAGTPVIAFARGGLREIVADGVTGVLVTPGDIGGAAEAVHRLGGISRQACRRHALTHLDLEHTLDAHERLYHSLARGVWPPRIRDGDR